MIKSRAGKVIVKVLASLLQKGDEREMNGKET